MLKLRKGDIEERKMANVFDATKYILMKQGPITTMKLQKLVYYGQAWSVAWDEKPLFGEQIQAWACGPVVRDLYDEHKGMFLISDLGKGSINNLKPEEIETIEAILEAYGNKPAQWLSDLTHMEAPWNEARKGIPAGQNCENEITLSSLEEYYGSMLEDSEPV